MSFKQTHSPTYEYTNHQLYHDLRRTPGSPGFARAVPGTTSMTVSSENQVAFGAPGIEPRWTSSAKEGVGTAYHTSCRLWFTLSHGIINEIYYPRVDQPNTRDCQFLITDGETFCHEEKRDLTHLVEYPDKNCPFYRVTNTDPNGRYRIVKHILTDPPHSVLLVDTKIELMDESLRGKLRVYLLLAPHGNSNCGWCTEIGETPLMHSLCGILQDVHMVTAST